jgi:hypothetical protein
MSTPSEPQPNIANQQVSSPLEADEKLDSGKSTLTKLNIEILNLNLQGVWDYKQTEITKHKCNLCKCHIMAPTYNNLMQGHITQKKNPICLGTCGHTFHKSCIDTWISTKGKVSCPIDMTPWNFSKELDSNTTSKSKYVDEDDFVDKSKSRSVNKN